MVLSKIIRKTKKTNIENVKSMSSDLFANFGAKFSGNIHYISNTENK